MSNFRHLTNKEQQILLNAHINDLYLQRANNIKSYDMCLINEPLRLYFIRAIKQCEIDLTALKEHEHEC